MKVSLNWLKDYIDVDLPVGELSERLTMLGFEVEDVRNLGERFKSFLVGAVLEVRKHPGADKLSLCKVNIGNEILEIVCGAANVAPGQKVAVALAGAIVPHNQHDPEGQPFVVSLVKIRGESSQGMICSSYELDLGEDREGILVLDDVARPGTSLAEYLDLDDTVLEIGITPNRPDALSHVGIAREIGAIFSKRVKLPPVRLRENRRRVAEYASVKVDDRVGCPRYTARIVTGVTVGDSPKWLKNRLSTVGIRPVNNVVDITNFVLMEIGQPLHAFDYDRIEGHTVIVRKGGKGKSFITLDGKNRILRGSELMICDSSGPVALAGVMGGANTEITTATRNVFIESAYFDAGSIRGTSKYLGISTDASQRFERGADPAITDWAADRAASLIQKICGGEISRGRIDEYPEIILPRRITLRVEKLNKILGTTLDRKEISSLLKRLSILPRSSKSRKSPARFLSFEVPTYRPDLQREIDLVEEVARVYGYNKIETKAQTVLRYPEKVDEEDFEGFLRQWLVGNGYNEVITNSMQEKSIAGLASPYYVEIANPISKDMAALRTSLTTSLLAVVRNNIFHGTRDLRLFEIGKVYFKEGDSGDHGSTDRFREEERLILGLSGVSSPHSWDSKARHCDMSDIKGEVQALFNKIFLDKFKFIPYSTTKALTQSGLVIEINGIEAGYMGTVSTELLKRYEIEQEVFVADFAVDVLNQFSRRESKYKSMGEAPRWVPGRRQRGYFFDPYLDNRKKDD